MHTCVDCGRDCTCRASDEETCVGCTDCADPREDDDEDDDLDEDEDGFS